MANDPAAAGMGSALLVERLAVRAALLERASYEHLLGELRQLLSLSHDELVSDYGRYEDRLLAPDALAFLDDVTIRPVKPRPSPPELQAIVDEVVGLPDDARRIMILNWSFELHIKAKWDKTLAQSGEEFQAALDAETGSPTTRDWRH